MSIQVISLGIEQAIIGGDALLLVDCGDGAAARWAAAGLTPEGPDAVLITDGSIDRIAGLFGLLASARAHQRRRPFTLVHHLSDERVPPLIEAFVRSFGADFPVRMEPESPGARLRFGEIDVQLRPAALGVGYRIERGGERVELRAGHEA